MRIKAKIKDGTVWITDVRIFPQFNDQKGPHTLYRIELDGLKYIGRNVMSTEVIILEKTTKLSLFTLHRKLEYEYNRKGNKRDTILPI